MAKSKQFTEDDDALLAELGWEVETKKASSHTVREERIIAGFEEIKCFYEQHGRLPAHGEDKDIFERLYAVRLDKIRASVECREALSDIDGHGLLSAYPPAHESASNHMDDDELLTELGVSVESDVTKLTHVKTRAEIRAAEEIAQRTPCIDFDQFKPLFAAVQNDLDNDVRQTREFKDNAAIKQGEFFILGGQKVYVAAMGEEFRSDYDRPDRRLRVIYDNGTESDILLRSLQRALNKDETGRRISDPVAGPLFGNTAESEDTESGTIYVLRSESEHPTIAANRNLIHKIGVTGSKVETRIANAALDATYLLAKVEVVATYKLFNINRTKLERLIHKVFGAAKLELVINDRLGHPIKPQEWFLVPLNVIDEAVEKIKDQSIKNFIYDPATVALRKIDS